jgi:hypothetical protein
MGYIVLTVLLAAIALMLAYYASLALSIKVHTIKGTPGGKFTLLKSRSVNQRDQDEATALLAYERQLRRLAYESVDIVKKEVFYNDADMSADYFIVVVYNRRLKLPLLSARYYFDKNDIQSTLTGDTRSTGGFDSWVDIEVKDGGKMFLADRLSGNTEHMFYKSYRNFIFYRFYTEIVTKNPGAKMIVMARSEKHEKLLTKYLRLGLNIRGFTIHYGKGHWILLGDWVSMYKSKRTAMVRDLLLLGRLSFNSLKQWRG